MVTRGRRNKKRIRRRRRKRKRKRRRRARNVSVFTAVVFTSSMLVGSSHTTPLVTVKAGVTFLSFASSGNLCTELRE
jgi:hypothetical protein